MLTDTDVENFIIDSNESGKRVFSIVAQTGTGKSTTFPIGLYKKRKSVFVVQPTIAAVMGLARTVSSMIPKEMVGTAADREAKYFNRYLRSRDTQITPIVYCTSGHLKNLLLKMAEKSRGVRFVDYVLLDEAHTGSLDYDLIMYLYRYLLDLGESLPQLILVTATPGRVPFDKSDIFTAAYKGTSFPVEIFYHKRDYESNQSAQRMIYPDLAAVVAEWHKARPVASNEVDGWLVFCPGKPEIQVIVKALQENTEKTMIVPLYSNMDGDSMKYLDEPPFGFRKIVVSTNVAEASITVPGLSGVFDSTFEKIVVTAGNGGTMLIPAHISKISATQRKGRAGRTKPGFCYRMCTEKGYSEFEEIRKREIERIPPDGLILDLISRGLEVEKIVIDGAVTTAVMADVKERLELIGLLSNSGKSVTEAGKFVQNLPLSPRMGMFYWLWKNSGGYTDSEGKEVKGKELPLFVGACIAAAIDGYGSGYVFIPREIADKDDFIKDAFGKYRSKSGLRFSLKILVEMIERFENFRIDYASMAKYSVIKSLNNQQVKGFLSNVRALLEKASHKVEMGSFNVDRAVDAAMPYLVQVYRDLIYPKNDKDHIARFDKGMIIPTFKDYMIPLVQMGNPNGKMNVQLFESTDNIDIDSIIPISLSRKAVLPGSKTGSKAKTPDPKVLKEPKIQKPKLMPEDGDPVFVDNMKSIYEDATAKIDPKRMIWLPSYQQNAYIVDKQDPKLLNETYLADIVDVDGILFRLVD
jgi:hypothetical protein